MTHRFTFVLKNKRITTKLENVLYKRCRDATLFSSNRTVYLAFDRDAKSLPDAIASAAQDAVLVGCRIARTILDPEA